jgi:hypothetical protein
VGGWGGGGPGEGGGGEIVQSRQKAPKVQLLAMAPGQLGGSTT